MQIYPNRKTQIVSTTVVKLSSPINCKFLFQRLKVSKIVVNQKYKAEIPINISHLLHCYKILHVMLSFLYQQTNINIWVTPSVLDDRHCHIDAIVTFGKRHTHVIGITSLNHYYLFPIYSRCWYCQCGLFISA